MFRRATPADIPFIESLLAEFYAKQGSVYGILYDRESTLALIDGLVASHIVLVGPTSCAAASLHPFPYNSAITVAFVVFWYFQSPREITILEALERACLAAGAHKVSVTSHYPHNRIGRWYGKQGYVPIESQWIKGGDVD